MYWQFTLSDGTTQLTLDNEPEGWDSGVAHITRDTDKHGVAFDYTIGNIRYYGDGADFLRSRYESLLTESKVNLIIKYRCSLNSDWVEFYTGKIDFGTYKEFSGIDCYVMANVEATDVVMTFNNRFDQKVNLETLASFDGVTLPAYEGLGIETLLKAKALPVSDHAEVSQDTTVTSTFNGGLQQPFIDTNQPIGVPSNLNYEQFSIGFNKVIASEIGNTSMGGVAFDMVQNCGGPGGGSCSGSRLPTKDIYPLFAAPMINFSAGSSSYGQLNGVCTLDFQILGTLKNPYCYLGDINFYILKLPFSTDPNFGTEYSDYEEIYYRNIQSTNGPQPPGTNSALSILATSLVINLNDGDRLYCMYGFTERKTQSQIDALLNNNSISAIEIEFREQTFFKVYNLSRGGDNSASSAKSFLINESLARATEAITNNEMTAYSEYFGRLDSLPYPAPAVGCGAMEVLTNGLFIRRVDEVKSNTLPILSVSLKDIWEGLNPIHNIGFGIEDDVNRPGKKWLRVEPMKYFYPENVIFTATGIETLSKECQPEKIYSKYLFGYSKWEAQQFTGLDEFLTKREYRTKLTSVNNTFNQVSSFVASGYTIEIVRRIGNDTSKDNTYDKDIFIVCVVFGNTQYFLSTTWTLNGANYTIDSLGVGAFVGEYSPDKHIDITGDGYTAENVPWVFISNNAIQIPASYWPVGQVSSIHISIHGYVAEQGNVNNPTNIIDPDTIYNYRISPIRNAMRWVKSIFQSYKNVTPEIIFTDGDGNVYAEGQLSSAGGCRLENSIAKENMTVTPAIFTDPSNAAPVFSPELVTFDCPVSVEDFVNIRNNRMGLIGYEFRGVTKYGWISDLQYNFESGMATFQLIPKY